MDQNIDFSDLLKKARAQSGKTQAELARALNVSTSSVSRWERSGDCSLTNASKWFEFCKVLVSMRISSKEKESGQPLQPICDRCAQQASCAGNNIVLGKKCLDSKIGLMVRFVGNVPDDCPYVAEHVVLWDAFGESQ
jgi:DNA-binding XRE family transcriptional regulator